MKSLFVLLTVLSLGGCCAGLDAEMVRGKLSKELHVGDSREKVELVLKRHGIDFDYEDEPEQRYHAIIRGKNCAFDKSVTVNVYIINKSGLVSKIEVFNSYTFL